MVKEIPLLGEMSAKRTKGSAVFAEEAASGEEAGADNLLAVTEGSMAPFGKRVACDTLSPNGD